MFDIKPFGKKKAEKRKRKHILGRIPGSMKAPKIIESKKRKYEKDTNNKDLRHYFKK